MPITKLTEDEVKLLGIQEPETATPQRAGDTLGKISGVLDAVFGGGVIGEAIGTQIAKAKATPQERQFIEGPTGKQVAGDVLRTGALFTPVGRTASFASKALPLGKASGLAGQAAAGATAGLGFDVGLALREEEPVSFEATTVGAALPPAVAGTAAAVKKFGVLARELGGVGTGAGGQAIQELFEASKAGGPQAKAATDALRGRIDANVLAEDARGALQKVINRRDFEYQQAFPQLINNKQQLDVRPIVGKFEQSLKNFQITKNPDGTLNFSKSPIRFSEEGKNKIQLIADEMIDFGKTVEDRTPLAVDSLKRAFQDLFSDSSQVRAFTAGMVKETRGVLSKVEGYDKMVKDYERSTGFIKELTRSISADRKAGLETTFKKLTSSLRVNNELRAQFLKQLDEEAGEFLTAKVAGQQLSEVLPRGILRAFGAAGAGLGIAFQGLSAALPFLQLLVATSPRVVGEFVRVLGFTARQTQAIVKSIKQIAPKGVAPGDVLLDKLQ